MYNISSSIIQNFAFDRSQALGGVWSCALSVCLEHICESDVSEAFCTSNITSDNSVNTTLSLISKMNVQQLSDGIRHLARTLGQLDAENIQLTQGQDKVPERW